MASNITGRLLNASRRPCQGGYFLVGDVYEDIHHRFADGSRISTSNVLEEEGNIILTRNSIYEVESWED